MNARSVLLGTLFAPLLIFAAGCGKSASTTAPAASLAPSPDTVVRIHWIGRRRLDLDANGYFVSRIWDLPETKALQQQTADKLATNALRIIFGNAAAQIPPFIFRPLFDDIVLEESYFEFSAPMNSQTPEWCFAIHPNPHRAGGWETNLTVIAQVLTGGSATRDELVHGWTINGSNPARRRATVSHLGEWVMITFGPEKSPLFDSVSERLLHGNVALSPGPTNFWLEAEVDLNRIARLRSWKTTGELPQVQINLTGDGSHVITQGLLAFSNALSLPMGAWTAPTNLIHQPMLSFTALRGFQSLLSGSKIWTDVRIRVPNQLFFWSLSGNPFWTYGAVPNADAAREVSSLSDLLLRQGNSWLATNGYVGFHPAADSNGVIWGNVPTLTPFIKASRAGDQGWLYAGLLPDPGAGTNAPLPDSILQNLARQTNLVYYDWQQTGPLLSPRFSLLQTARQLVRAPALPTDCASMNWLGVIMPRLDVSETTITQTSSNELTFYRKSTVGLTALELHLLADWLESPDFPCGLYSLRASSARPPINVPEKR